MHSEDTTTLFRTFYDAALRKDIEAVADMIDGECEYVLEPDREIAKGKKAVIEMAGRGSHAFDRTQPEIIFDAANPEWGVFEFINQGTASFP
jgi:hypothetical protein